MVGFRNMAVHDYQKVNLHILRSILNEHLVDFGSFIIGNLRLIFIFLLQSRWLQGSCRLLGGRMLAFEFVRAPWERGLVLE